MAWSTRRIALLAAGVLVLSMATAYVAALADGAAPEAPGVPVTSDGTGPGVDAHAVIAHIDTGINPYHEVFRDDSPQAEQHPTTYIDGYPEDATALHLTLDASSWQEAFEQDRAIWENLEEGELYWIPGTKIIGAISFGAGGTFCPALSQPPANLVGDPDPPEDDTECTEHTLLDDHGHGTMTATRAAGNNGSLCPDCRLVSIEGLGASQVDWAADQGWIDVQTNSWGFLVGDPVTSALDEASDGTTRQAIEHAAERHLVYFASGNGAGGFFGFAPWPTHLQPTHLEGVVSVGAHDNGKMAYWQGTPPHVVSDGFQPPAADNRDLTEFGPTAFACCTSTAAPYAAGLGARVVQEARQILDDPSVGVDDGVFASGTAPDVDTGPLADGELNLTELRELIKDTAQPRPVETEHSGNAHWMGEPTDSDPDLVTWGPGDNPYCPGCWTLPVAWEDIPEEAPAYTMIGYGAADTRALESATQVLEGEIDQPERDEVDRFFELYRTTARPFHHPEDPVG